MSIFFIGKEVNVDSVTLQGLTPLHFAVMNDHISVAEILIEKGATPKFAASNVYITIKTHLIFAEYYRKYWDCDKAVHHLSTAIKYHDEHNDSQNIVKSLTELRLWRLQCLAPILFPIAYLDGCMSGHIPQLENQWETEIRNIEAEQLKLVDSIEETRNKLFCYEQSDKRNEIEECMGEIDNPLFP